MGNGEDGKKPSFQRLITASGRGISVNMEHGHQVYYKENSKQFWLEVLNVTVAYIPNTSSYIGVLWLLVLRATSYLCIAIIVQS